jgi:hypothetical protein
MCAKSAKALKVPLHILLIPESYMEEKKLENLKKASISGNTSESRA